MSLFLTLGRMVSRVLAVFGLAAFILTALLMDFLHRSRVDDLTGQDLPRIAIVFTGQYDRIHLGLDLLSSDRVDRLFITGVNGPAGLDLDRFTAQFSLSADQADWLETGKIVLAPDARSTFENALEARCWLQRQPDVEAVALITSRRHMARASAALQHAIWPVDVVRIYSDPFDEYDELQLDLRAFAAFAATWSTTLLPTHLWPANEPSICQA